MVADGSNCMPYLKALSDETRWQVIESLIASDEPMTLSELAAKLGISNYNASRHVSVLEEVGILKKTKDGRRKYLTVADSCREHVSSSQNSRDILNLGCCTFEFPQEKKV